MPNLRRKKQGCGLKHQVWNGRDMWKCEVPSCRFQTFTPAEAATGIETCPAAKQK